MNCANHADASAVAYCRTCGKALCGNCTRPVRGVIYCEDCLGAKMEGVPAGAAGFTPVAFNPPAPGQVPPPTVATGTGSGPNPTVAGILAGFFPVGVGAVYNGQYAKGLSHLVVSGLLIAGCTAADNGHSTLLGVACAFGILFFYVYQIIDSVRSARAIQTGQPAPDPYGLAATFSGGTKIEASKVPMGAIVLILLGLLFLLNTLGLTEYGLDRFWPVILIVLGGWMFARNWGWLGPRMNATRLREKLASHGHSVAVQNAFASVVSCQCARCRTRRLMGPAIIFTIGVLFLLQNLDVANLHFDRTWPVILLVVGAMKLLQSSASLEGHNPGGGSAANAPMAGGPLPPTPPIPPAPPVPPTGEVNRG
jgi:hypothetical protein